MKKILILIGLLSAFAIAKADGLILDPIDPGQLDPDPDKELVVGVSASIEDGVLTITTDVATHGVVATIYDSSSVAVYTSVSEIEGKLHEFIVGELPSGDYVLEVEIGDTLTSGEFTID